MVLIIDNYDSFSYNLFQFVGMCTSEEVLVRRNDKISIDMIEAIKPKHIIISPGPGFPKDAGMSMEIIDYFKSKIPILGVCLGHQGIGEVFGGKVIHARKLMHGKASKITVDITCPIFKNLPPVILAARYHSLVVDKDCPPKELIVTATDESGEIMAVKHKDFNVFGVQFHPESILTPLGMEIIKSFLEVEHA